MPTTIEGIQSQIDEASMPGFRGQLLARGQARAMIWRNGILPPEAPIFSPTLSYDLQSYGYSMLGLALRLREMGGDPVRVRIACEQAAASLESVMAKGAQGESDRDFHFVVAAAAYHLAHLSARAYSILTIVRNEQNFSPIEKMLTHLMLRDLRSLERLIFLSKAEGVASDAAIVARIQARLDANPGAVLQGENALLLEEVDFAIADQFSSAMANFLLALERGERALLDRAVTLLRDGLAICAELNLLPQWWAHKIAVHLLSDFWDASFHERLPLVPAGGQAVAWGQLRELFMATLLRRPKAEVDLWPSQTAAATRAVNQLDDLVISLPTSAGKTRIAELCILRCLAGDKRVIFVTPLRALSAQTETTLQRTFGPLGKTISSLYGSIGVNGVDEDAIRLRHIVVATPEKLDFALRNDPTLLDDVGLLVFDEGHMIGLNEREVRYEVQIQRLLKRPDAPQRRIVCLSAILPDGDQLEDFSNWLCRDQPGGVVKNDWRPTRLRYGEVVWQGQTARLNLRVGDERPFVPRFLTAAIPPVGRRPTPFPRDLGELCLATAWRLVGDGQSVLVFCPVRRHVEPFATRIVDLHRRGALPSLLEVEEQSLRTAIVLGEEWLGVDHPILKCLRLGVAIHHGALPTSYRKEIEKLLQRGILKVTISSPTLAQGLNLSATTVIFHSLTRNKKTIETSEFKNVIGRAGRAYVDVEGLVLYPVYDNHARRTAQWEGLIADLSTREMESGLVRLVLTLLIRMNKRLGGTLEQLVDYVVNNAEAWTFPEVAGESPDARERERADWEKYVASLDTAILGLIGEAEVLDADIPVALDGILASSLWERRLNRRSEQTKAAIKAGLTARGRYVWARSTGPRRRGYFLAGVGLTTGMALDELAPIANDLLVQANAATVVGNQEAAIDAITSLAERVFLISPFVPEDLPENWRELLRLWLSGASLAEAAVGQEAEVLKFVEGGLVYRLPWAMEAMRVRSMANGDTVGPFELSLENFELSAAVSAVETGTLNRPASILIQAGFTSRIAAIRAVTDTQATFTNMAELRQWMTTPAVIALSGVGNWPTPETSEVWASFQGSLIPNATGIWSEHRFWCSVIWHPGAELPPGSPVRFQSLNGQTLVFSSDGLLVGGANAVLNPDRRGLLRSTVMDEPGKILLSYLGPDDLLPK